MNKKKYIVSLISIVLISSTLVTPMYAWFIDDFISALKKINSTVTNYIDKTQDAIDKAKKAEDVFETISNILLKEKVNIDKLKNATDKVSGTVSKWADKFAQYKWMFDNWSFWYVALQAWSKQKKNSDVYQKNTSHYFTSKVIVYAYIIQKLNDNKARNWWAITDYTKYLNESTTDLKNICNAQKDYISYLNTLIKYLDDSQVWTVFNDTQYAVWILKNQFKLKFPGDHTKLPNELIKSVRDKYVLESSATCANANFNVQKTKLLTFFWWAKNLYSKTYTSSNLYTQFSKEFIKLLRVNDKSYWKPNNYGYNMDKTKMMSFRTSDAHAISQAFIKVYWGDMKKAVNSVPEDIFGDCDKGKYCYYPSGLFY